MDEVFQNSAQKSHGNVDMGYYAMRRDMPYTGMPCLMRNPKSYQTDGDLLANHSSQVWNFNEILFLLDSVQYHNHEEFSISAQK
jgi:hypothetical protein